MSCPNCGQPMNLVTADNQNILHCANCGGSFFEKNGVNRITVSTAQRLAEDKITTEVSGQIKKCPKDQAALSPLETGQNIPPDVTLLKCPKCFGVFAYADDLIKFKTAQEIKINFFKIWSTPLPSLKAVLVFGFIAVISLSLVGLGFLPQKSVAPLQATDLIKKITMSKSGRYLLISFRTSVPLRSKIIFKDGAGNIKLEKIISERPTTLHYLTVTDIDTDQKLTYQIILIDEKGREMKTEEKRLEIF